jgi:hypothetical protein
MGLFQNFVGLNTFIYEPVGWHTDGTGVENDHLGVSGFAPYVYGSYALNVVGHYGNTLLPEGTIGTGNGASIPSIYHQIKYGFGVYSQFLFWRGADGQGGSVKYALNVAETNTYMSGADQRNTNACNLLLTHRNGPYGFPSWAQIRVAQNPLTRKQIKNNIYTFSPGGLYRNFSGRQYLEKYGPLEMLVEPMLTSKYKPLEYNFGYFRPDLKLREFTLKADLTNEIGFFANDKLDDLYITKLLTSDDYEQVKFMYLNNALNNNRNPIDSLELIKYKEVIYPREVNTFLSQTRDRKNYSSGFWRDKRSLRDEFDITGYDYSTIQSNTLGPLTVPTMSMWPLDSEPDFLTKGDHGFLHIGYSGSTHTIGVNNATSVGQATTIQHGGLASSGSGILQNTFSQFGFIDTTKTNKHMLDAPTYFHRHATAHVNSAVGRSGLKTVVTSTSYINGHIPMTLLLRGSALWEANTHASFETIDNLGVITRTARSKNPFYDSYAKYNEYIRLIGKDYTLVPEFNISDSMDFYLKSGPSARNKAFLEVKGGGILSKSVGQTSFGVTNFITSSAQNEFYQTYSNTDFFKMFDVVEDDNDDIIKPSVVKLKCKAIKKFLPYKGFYPADRTVDIAKQFFLSYANNIFTHQGFSAVENHMNAATQRVNMLSGSAAVSSYRFKPINTAMFSPGILYNTIKSGMACDYACTEPTYFEGQNTYFTTRVNEAKLTASNGDIYQDFSLQGGYGFPNYSSTPHPFYYNRLPFEALVEPENYLSRRLISDSEPHPSGNSQLVNGLTQGSDDDKYKLMINNFLAEVPRFFLKRKRFTHFRSRKQGNPNFGNIINHRKLYGMRIKIKRSMDGTKVKDETLNGAQVMLPQDETPLNQSINETFTMYSRPSAFGPAHAGLPAGSEYFENDQYSHLQGYNFPHTPPYYHGEAWCDIIFEPTSRGKVTINDIFSGSNIYQLRFWQGRNNEFGTQLSSSTSGVTASFGAGASGNAMNALASSTARGFQYSLNTNLHRTGSHGIPINFNAMQITSSFNIFNKVGGTSAVNSFEINGIQISQDDSADDEARWIIQSKFETPMLNFQPSEESPISLPTIGREMVPRGMWHQYGLLPADDEGVFIEIVDIPQDWWEECRLPIYGYRLESEVASQVPRNMDYRTVATTNGSAPESLADLVGFPKGQTIRLGEIADRKIIKECIVAVPFKVVRGRRKYFKIDKRDFKKAIRIFNRGEESENTIGKSVLDIVEKMKEYSIPLEFDFLKDENIDPFAMYFFEFTHELSKNDLSDIWQNLPPNLGLEHDMAETEISHELLSNELFGTRRKRSNASQIIRDDKQTLFDSEIQWMVFKVKERANKSYNNLMYGKEKEEIDFSYNWPYDFFSLVELVKMEAEVEFSDIQEQDNKRIPRPIESKRLMAKVFDLPDDND